MGGKTYLASDLATELELPRSTINDWLTRYGDFLESETRGKRKVYSAKTLRILKEIAEMRNDNKNSFEIEQLLGARYGIRPEVAPPKVEAPENAGVAGGSDETLPATQEGGLPATRPAFEQMTVQINAEFMKLANRLEDAERVRRRLVHRMWAITAVMIITLAMLLIILALVMYQLLGRIERKNQAAAEAITKESVVKFDEMAVVLDGSRQDFEKNISKLQNELVEQRKAFEQKIKEMEENSADRAEAQILVFKEEFARRQLEELKRIEELRKTIRDNAEAQIKVVREEALKREAEAAKREAEKALPPEQPLAPKPIEKPAEKPAEKPVLEEKATPAPTSAPAPASPAAEAAK